MPQYKLTYFNLRGRGELIRLLFAYAGQEYEDFRFEIAEWSEYKEKMPLKQVPVLEVDGVKLTQSHSIARYLARTFKIAGKTDLEEAQADEYVDIIYDLISDMREMYFEQNPEKKKEMGQKFLTEKLAPQLQRIEKRLEANGGEHLVGTGLTWADIAFYGYLDMAGVFCGEAIYENAPLMKALITTVGDNENIKKYVDSRPATPF